MVSLRKIIPFSLRLRVETEIFKTLAKGSRIVEYPFIIGNADITKPSKTLVFGCFNDFAAIQLASVGFEVFGFDLHDNVFNHPNFKFLRETFFRHRKGFRMVSLSWRSLLAASNMQSLTCAVNRS